jgi:hypothetical protein
MDAANVEGTFLILPMNKQALERLIVLYSDQGQSSFKIPTKELNWLFMNTAA